jgi:CobQ-like glutamine amidotransferase family enzyme
VTPFSQLSIAVLLPDVLGTYSDVGNAVVLAQRARWRGVQARVQHITADQVPPTTCDIYLLGGGEDTAQSFAITWLNRHPALRHALGGPAAVFAVCAGLQIVGDTLTDRHGRRHGGLGLLDLRTVPGPRRAVGEVITRCTIPGVGLITGFANHCGATTLGPATRPLGTVITGPGNDARVRHRDAVDGAVGAHLVATYLHGPVLARNPALADHVLVRATGLSFAATPDSQVPDLPALRTVYLRRARRTAAAPATRADAR